MIVQMLWIERTSSKNFNQICPSMVFSFFITVIYFVPFNIFRLPSDGEEKQSQLCKYRIKCNVNIEQYSTHIRTCSGGGRAAIVVRLEMRHTRIQQK